jgi:simple sugar transport system permease protein
VTSSLNDAAERLKTAVAPVDVKSVGASRWQRMAVTSASSIFAVLFALAVCAVILLITGKNPLTAYSTLFGAVTETRVLQDAVQRAIPLFISAAAVAIGFKMNLFNIGVEGQMRVSLLSTAVVGGLVTLPAPLHVLFCLLVAMATGAAWAGIAAYLKVKRGVNEVIATIMLNFIALALVAWLLDDYFRDTSNSQGVLIKTEELPRSAWIPDIVDGRVSGVLVIAAVVLFAMWVLVWKTKFGFRLRASGANPGAARATGVNPNRMIALSLFISGALAGLVGMRHLLGEDHAYENNQAEQSGFNGISVALLGRNHPLGIVFSGLLFGFLSAASGKLQLKEIPKEIVTIMQGIIVLAVVIINGAVARWDEQRIQRKAALALERAGVDG